MHSKRTAPLAWKVVYGFSSVFFRSFAEAEEIKAFMAIPRTGKAAGLEYTDSLWNGLIDHVTVYADERLVFTFKNGKEIAEQL